MPPDQNYNTGNGLTPVGSLKSDYIRCTICGAQVSSDVVPEDIVIRAWIECVDCIKKEKALDKSVGDSV